MQFLYNNTKKTEKYKCEKYSGWFAKDVRN